LIKFREQQTNNCHAYSPRLMEVQAREKGRRYSCVESGTRRLTKLQLRWMLSHLKSISCGIELIPAYKTLSTSSFSEYTLPSGPRIELLRIQRERRTKRREIMQRKASAVWQGGLKDGKGSISTDS